ncbi:hypothetical protein E2C01_068848 [Portunus trituberculatus]|uniref:Uncharacterized protein n=1 Tax=Portunus trituberculatus TaxID=210409 RepID=A0A5B7I0M5_PORTR|nr:hypothetical protein [Portunus trituberculatus]
MSCNSFASSHHTVVMPHPPHDSPCTSLDTLLPPTRPDLSCYIWLRLFTVRQEDLQVPSIGPSHSCCLLVCDAVHSFRAMSASAPSRPFLFIPTRQTGQVKAVCVCVCVLGLFEVWFLFGVVLLSFCWCICCRCCLMLRERVFLKFISLLFFFFN